jgi:hypothetical protein
LNGPLVFAITCVVIGLIVLGLTAPIVFPLVDAVRHKLSLLEQTWPCRPRRAAHVTTSISITSTPSATP